MDTFHLNSIRKHIRTKAPDILLACLNWADVIMVLCVDMLFISLQPANSKQNARTSISNEKNHVVDRRSKVLIWMRMNISRDA